MNVPSPSSKFSTVTEDNHQVAKEYVEWTSETACRLSDWHPLFPNQSGTKTLTSLENIHDTRTSLHHTREHLFSLQYVSSVT